MIRYLLDGRPLQDGSAMRGIGTYLRGLLSGYQSLGVSGDVGLLLERGAALPESLAAAGFRTHPTRLARLNRHLRGSSGRDRSADAPTPAAPASDCRRR